MLSTLICVFTLDRIGRRWTLYWGSVVQGIAMAAAGGLTTVGQSHPEGSAKAKVYSSGAVAMILLFTATFGATWLTVPWLYPAETFPLEVHAKGNAWGVAIKENTYYVFAAANVITIPMVWALYPESNQRTLEQMNLVFAVDSIWNWETERNFKILKEQNPELVQAAQRGALGIGSRDRFANPKQHRTKHVIGCPWHVSGGGEADLQARLGAFTNTEQIYDIDHPLFVLCIGLRYRG
ncbi:MAG: hypothetical protein Q9192_003718 [Flavoplaca navasiana]